MPKLAKRLNPIGRLFWLLIARGMLLPARTTLASSASSTPYGCLLEMRYAPSAYRAPTVQPAATEGMLPVRR